MEVKYAIMLILLGYLVLIGACWKFIIIPKMKFLRTNPKPKSKTEIESFQKHKQFL